MADREMTGLLEDAAFLGRAVERLSGLIEAQSEVVFRRHDILIPVKSCSLVTVLARLGAASAADLARALGVSHQLVLQKLPKLETLGLVAGEADAEDARRRVFSLSNEGRRQHDRFQACRVALQAAYADLFGEVGNVLEMTSKATVALQAKPLDLRMP